MAGTLLILFVLSIGEINHRENGVIVDRVDLIEINHYHNNGRSVLDQVIYWDWDFKTNRFQVVAWRMFKQPEQYPIRNWRINRYVSIFTDPGPSSFGEKTNRKIIAFQFRETWTEYDPEVFERDFLERDFRRGLGKIPEGKKLK